MMDICIKIDCYHLRPPCTTERSRRHVQLQYTVGIVALKTDDTVFMLRQFTNDFVACSCTFPISQECQNDELRAISTKENLLYYSFRRMLVQNTWQTSSTELVNRLRY